MGKGERRNHFKTAPQNWLPWQADPRDLKRAPEARKNSRGKKELKNWEREQRRCLIIQESMAQEPVLKDSILRKFSPATRLLLTQIENLTIEG